MKRFRYQYTFYKSIDLYKKVSLTEDNKIIRNINLTKEKFLLLTEKAKKSNKVIFSENNSDLEIFFVKRL